MGGAALKQVESAVCHNSEKERREKSLQQDKEL